jgi:hypothetical protein
MRRIGISPFIPLLFLIAAGWVQGEQEETFTESVVIFNTICAKCHEAQCSGRLSFKDALDASTSHIVRYYGDASGKRWLQEQLFVILNHMKEKCAYYPMDMPVPPQRVWGAQTLEKLSTYLERNYFIPVGPLSSGDHRLELTLDRNEKVTVHVVSETFNMVAEDCFQSAGGRLDIPFAVTEPGNHYVRVYPRTPLRLLRLAVVATDDDR